jgi:hypothetical protein
MRLVFGAQRVVYYGPAQLATSGARKATGAT